MKNLIKATGKIIFKNTPKTIDPNYTECKIAFKNMYRDSKNLMESLYNFYNSIQQVAHITKKISESACDIVNDSPQFYTQGRQMNYVSQEIDKLSMNFLKGQIDPYVFKPMENFIKEVEALKAMKKNRKEMRKEYDEIRGRVKKESEKSSNLDALRPLENELGISKQRYEEANYKFIYSTRSLLKRREQCLDLPFKNMMKILSQYLTGVSTQMMRLKSQFPNDVFDKSYATVANQKNLFSNPYANIPQTQPIVSPSPVPQIQQNIPQSQQSSQVDEKCLCLA